MRKRNLLQPLAVVLAALCLTSAALPVSASSSSPTFQQAPTIQGRYGRGDPLNVWDHNQIPPGRRPDINPRGRDRWGRTFGAPEIHPGLAAGGLALLIGGTMVLLGRRRPSRVQA